jgi:hypothetical protein
MEFTSSIDNSVEDYKGFDNGLNNINSPPAGYTVLETGGINRKNDPYSSSTYTVTVGVPKKKSSIFCSTLLNILRYLARRDLGLKISTRLTRRATISTGLKLRS